MNTAVEYKRVPSEFRTFKPQNSRISADLIIVCLWATFGFVLTAAAFALGFAAEVGQVLAVAG